MAQRLIINGDTGEINGELGLDDRIVKGKQTKFAKTHKTYFNKNKSFIKVYDGAIEALHNELTCGEFIFFFRLLNCLNFNGMLRDDTNEYLTIKNIALLFETSEANTRKIIGSLKKKDVLVSQYIIYRGKKVKTFIVNPFLIFKGQHISKEIYDLFKYSRFAGNGS